jgi:hypothetical protein
LFEKIRTEDTDRRKGQKKRTKEKDGRKGEKIRTEACIVIYPSLLNNLFNKYSRIN